MGRSSDWPRDRRCGQFSVVTFPVWPKDGVVVLAVEGRIPAPSSHCLGRSRDTSIHRPTLGPIEAWRTIHRNRLKGEESMASQVLQVSAVNSNVPLKQL